MNKNRWKTVYNLPFLLVCVILLFAVAIIRYVIHVQVIDNYRHALDISGIPFEWSLGSLRLDLIFLCISITLIFTIFILMLRTVGSLPRIEDSLNRILKGEYSTRIRLLQKDAINTLVDKLNKLLDLLEKKAKG